MEGSVQTAPAHVSAALNLPAQISIVVPTFNEEKNVPELIRRLDTVMSGLSWEVIFVDDDSRDGTLKALSEAAARDPRVRYLHRLGRRGLSSAVVEGIQSSNAPLIAVMDADLQHDEKILPAMVAKFAAPDVDLVVGSRYVEGGGTGEWDSKRLGMSRFATAIAGMVLKAQLSDPMSGFFMIRRDAFDIASRQLSTQGYKILLDIVASANRPLKIVEVPFVFGVREHGESKLDSAVLFEYAALLLDKTIGKYVPARFVMFSIVGAAGALVHLSVLAAAPKATDRQFLVAQIAAVFAAMTFNFFVNNLLTYRDRRLKGLWGTLGGLLSFYAVGLVGAVANVGIANVLFVQHYSWIVAGLAGILVGAVWNYAASSTFTWKSK